MTAAANTKLQGLTRSVPRWYEFEVAAPAAPEALEEFSIIERGAGRLAFRWHGSDTAADYRIEYTVDGNGWHQADGIAQSEAAEVTLRITPTNPAGDGPPSEATAWTRQLYAIWAEAQFDTAQLPDPAIWGTGPGHTGKPVSWRWTTVEN